MMHDLTGDERAKLTEANRLLTEITRGHSHACECLLCDARSSTDVQEEEAFHVRYRPAAWDA